jgi:ABC-type transport system involved in multi-copper enzyme maturation permease subunit
MTTVLRADLVRLATLRSSYAVTFLLVCVVAGITAASLSEAGGPDMSSATRLREPLSASVGILVAVALALFAAMRVAGEYRYGTIDLRLLASPSRTRLLAAVLAAHGLLGLVVGAAGLAVGLAIAVPILESKGLSMGMTPQIGASILLAVVAFSVIGVCCAVICRSQPAAVLVIVGMFVVEKLVGLFVGGVAEYLPYGLLTPLLRLEGGTVAPGRAALVLVAITGALVVASSLFFRRRDVTR